MMDRWMRSELFSSNIFSNLLSNESNYMLCTLDISKLEEQRYKKGLLEAGCVLICEM